MLRKWLVIVSVMTAATGCGSTGPRGPVACKPCGGALFLDLGKLIDPQHADELTDIQVCTDGACSSFAYDLPSLASEKGISLNFGGRGLEKHTLAIRLLKGTTVTAEASSPDLVLPPIAKQGNGCGCAAWFVSYDPQARSLVRSADPTHY